MNAVPSQKKNPKRVFWVLILIITVMVVGGTGAWFFAAGKFEQAAQQMRQKMAERNRIIACENQQVRGYPFRLGIFCDRISIEDTKKQQKLTSGAVRTAAQIYDPGKLVAEFDGPAMFSDQRMGLYKINWQNLRSSVQASLSGIERTSIVSNATIVHQDKNDAQILSAETLELHARKLNENDLELAFGARDLALAIGPNASETASKPFQISAQLTGQELFNTFQTNQNLIAYLKKNGGSGILKSLKLEIPGDGILELSGPLSVDVNGQLSANIEVAISGLRPLIQFFSAFTPASKEHLEKVELTMEMFASKAPSEKFRKFNIQIANGNIQLGLLPLGRIPPIF